MPNLREEQWIAQLRSYIGVRFEHLGRGRHGVDCAGLLACAAEDLGCAGGAKKVGGYDRVPEDRMFTTVVGQFVDAIPYNRLQPLRSQVRVGDIITFWIDNPRLPRHLGVYTKTDEYGLDWMIHSYAKLDRGVVEQPIDASYWLPRIDRLWRLKELNKGD